jgi:hypothetical protein
MWAIARGIRHAPPACRARRAAPPLLPADTAADALYTAAWKEFRSHVDRSDLHLARQTSNRIIAGLTKQSRREPRPSEALVALILPDLLSFLSPSLSPDFLPSILALLFCFAQVSVPAFVSLCPYAQLTAFYLQFPADLQSKQRLQSLIQFLIPTLPPDSHPELLAFFLGSFPDFALWRENATLINILLQSLCSLCRCIEESLLSNALPDLFGVIDECWTPDRMFCFYRTVAEWAQVIAARGLNFFALNRPLFEHLVNTLGDLRCQPHTPVITMLCQHIFHFGPREIGAIPIGQLFAILAIAARDGDGCNEILVLFANLIVDDLEAIAAMCEDEALELFSELISEKEYQVKHCVMWLCWNIVNLGTAEQIRRLLGAPRIADALIDSLELTDDEFLFGLIAPTIAALMEKGGSLGIEEFLGALLERAREKPELLPLLERYEPLPDSAICA